MDKIEHTHPERGDWRGGAFSAAVEVDGWIFVSGQGPLDMASGVYKPATIEEETLLTLKNIQGILEAANCSLDNVVKATVHLGDMNDFRAFNRVYRDFFRDVPILPARTAVQSVMWGGMKIEIDVIARKPSDRG